MTNFQLEEFVRRGGVLLSDTRKIFADYDGLGLEFKPLPETMKPAEGPIKLVFVGQYSSGKSSIIKMLSGIETEIGAGIKTQEAHTYRWGDLEIIDTPGIHTEIRPDHDEKTYYEIDHAALLIFVVTNEGFDDRMGKHFRKLAIEQDRGKNMVLVVNKMDRTGLGNVPEQQEVIAQDLKKVIEPLTPESLYLSFLDTESYFAWLDETDEEIKNLLYEQSGLEKFVTNLNAFVASRGVLSKVQAPLETLKSAVTNVIGESENLSVDRDIDAAEELLRRRQKTLLDGRRRINTEISELAETLCTKIKTEGSNAASKIVAGISEDEAKRVVEAAQLQAETYVSAYKSQISSRLADICIEIGKEIDTIDSSNFAVNVQVNLSNRISSAPSNDANALTLTKNALSLDVALTSGEVAANSSGLISTVKEIGKFLGFKFAPWGAVNLVKYLGWIGAAYSAWQILKTLFGEDKQKKMEEDLRKAREEIQNGFNAAAENIRTEIIRETTSKMDELTAPVLREANDKIAEFQRKKDRLKSLGHALQKILADVKTLMSEVQQTAKA